MPETLVTYGAMIARNLRAARGAAALSQKEVATRMRDLGFPTWKHQTVGMCENGHRRVTAEETAGLAEVLNVSMTDLLYPPHSEQVMLPGGQVIDLPAAAMVRPR